jgi:hypothetical protein
MAVERYLDELVREEGDRHNYALFTHYTIGQRVENGIICWELYWGDPPGIPKSSHPTQIRRRTSVPFVQ